MKCGQDLESDWFNTCVSLYQESLTIEGGGAEMLRQMITHGKVCILTILLKANEIHAHFSCWFGIKWPIFAYMHWTVKLSDKNYIFGDAGIWVYYIWSE